MGSPIDGGLSLAKRKKSRSAKGFTLLEMSIVIVIIGLIVGGIVFARTMIRSSQIRSVMTDLNNYKSAFGAFQMKYNALPGDMSTATSYWGIAGGTGSDATCFAAAEVGTATCNGNGDAKIANEPSATKYEELFLAWRHLSNAGLVSGSYTGVAGANSSNNTVVGTNIPQTRITGGGILLTYAGQSPSWQWFSGDYGHSFIFGADDGTNENTNEIITTEEAQSIDSKIDDGMPGLGTVRSFTASRMPCATTSVVSTAAYNLAANNGNVCSLIMLTGF